MTGEMTLAKPVFRPALVLLATFTLLLGVGYPLLVKALVENAWNAQVNDMAIHDPSGRVIASTLDAAPLDDPRYFWGKIVNASATDCYLGHRSYAPDCQALVKSRLALLQKDTNAVAPEDLTHFAVPGQMPKISPEAAAFQVHRVARARGVADADISALIEKSLHNPTYELGGGLYVNVLELNLRLDGKLK